MSRSPFVAGAVFCLAAACSKPVAAPAPAVRPTAVVSPPPATSPSADLALERLDTRVPVPLLPHMAQHQKENMREHLVAVQEIALATARNEFAAVEVAARQLGLSPGMERMCQHMGRGAPGFTEQALAFHRSADAIAAAARNHDPRAVMKALGATLHLCTGCHATFRQKVVDEATWAGLTAPAEGGGRSSTTPPYSGAP